MFIKQKLLSRKMRKGDYSEDSRNLQNREVKINLLKGIG